ncbi:TerB family tellurite resistance protein [Paraflavisolibacter sp. H34]|uniref:TerB family tellurite resistance protein n=1 Tax=Huijunlia imazamoxiresistens TaxID=3127457 RepID=UPI0030159C0D
MNPDQTILDGYSDQEKGAYLGAIASIATADKQASPEEVEYLTALATAARLSPEQQQQVLRSANSLSGEELTQYLDVLKGSELKFSLVTDLMAFARSDSDYSEAEKQHIRQMAQYLQIDAQQLALLDQVAEKAAAAPVQEDSPAAPNFLASGGLQQQLQSSGINTGSLLKGLLSFAGPFILAKMLRGDGRSSGGGGLGGMLGGALGGMFGGGNRAGRAAGGGGGGLGSLISMLNGGRGFGNAGGMLGKILKGF